MGPPVPGPLLRGVQQVPHLQPPLSGFLEQYDWPGNVRQLENLMERLVITAQDPILGIPALPLEYTADASAPAELLPGGTLAERMDAYEAQIIRDSYQRCGTTVAVARELGISQATAARKIAKYVTARRERRIPVHEFDPSQPQSFGRS